MKNRKIRAMTPSLNPTIQSLILHMYTIFEDSSLHSSRGGWSGGAKVLGKLPVPGRPTNLDYSRAGAYCACSRCGWGLFGHFFSRLSLLFSSPTLWETARYRLKYCLKGPLSPKQSINQQSVPEKTVTQI